MQITKFINKKPYLIAGPCSAESQEQLLSIAKSIEGIADVFGQAFGSLEQNQILELSLYLSSLMRKNPQLLLNLLKIMLHLTLL